MYLTKILTFFVTITSNNYKNYFFIHIGLVLDLHAELYKDAEGDEFDTCYQIVLTTTRGPIKIDMADDYSRYNMWATTINQMLMLPPSALTKYEHQFCNY